MQLKLFVKGAPRRRAAPGNQSVGSPQERRLRLASYRLSLNRWHRRSVFGTLAAVEEGFSLKQAAGQPGYACRQKSWVLG
jgi:hypothetical protein